KYLQIKTIMRGGCRRLAAVVSSFGCEMRANYIEKYLHCEKWGDFSNFYKKLFIFLQIMYNIN
ncbi:hypothetical protein, partial [Flexistipes sinusarabici]|uniref:hypothetical protein n=1 Tax=Flexistipes sinusarabici TaxID=2352 RepID=UPI00235238F9